MTRNQPFVPGFLPRTFTLSEWLAIIAIIANSRPVPVMRLYQELDLLP